MKEYNKMKKWFENQKEFKFESPELSYKVMNKMKEIANRSRGDILKMTHIANSGHPGGSISSIDFYTVIYSLSDIKKEKIVVSHGHTSPGVYSTLANLGILDRREVISFFRYSGSPYEGHVENNVPGICWTTGNLGQGLSAGCGYSLANKLKNTNNHTYVLMSDAEQAKGQVAEARRFASKFSLNNLTVIVDYNHIQISGKVENIMPVQIEEDCRASGWEVLRVDGHDFKSLYKAIRRAREDINSPYAILAETVMGKGISFMENEEKYHGKALKENELKRALEELNINNNIQEYKNIRENSDFKKVEDNTHREKLPEIKTGEPETYDTDAKIGNRDAFGNALLDMGKINGAGKIIALDCDLAGSVRVKKFGEVFPDYLIENGVSEHNTATVSGVLSTQGFQTFLADFGVFGLDEMYNQHRLNAINNTNLRIILTHCGINVGEDGKTHHCIDYLGLTRNLPNFSIIIPADANQTDRVIRYITRMEENVIIVMGRAKEGVIADTEGNPFFGNDYKFEYGKMDIIREGDDGVIVAYGYTLKLAVEIHSILKKHGINIAIINVPCPFALKEKDINKIAEYENIFTYEDHLRSSGLSLIISNLLSEYPQDVSLHSFGIEEFAPSGSTSGLYREIGLDPESIAERIKEHLT